MFASIFMNGNYPKYKIVIITFLYFSHNEKEKIIRPVTIWVLLLLILQPNTTITNCYNYAFTRTP